MINVLRHLTDFFLQAFSGQEKWSIIVVVEDVNVSTILEKIQYNILKLQST